MLVVLLTHPGDRQLTVQLCDHIRFLGNVTRHECLIVSPTGTDMRGIEDVLREAFGKVYTHHYPATMKGWPYGPNEAAAVAMLHIWANPELLYHYLMLEPDCVPRDKHWLDYIDAEYRRTGAPILGNRIDTIEVATHRITGRHTVGVAVYPKQFPRLCPLVKTLSTMTREYQIQGVIPPPWDAYFGPYTQKMTADTVLIQQLSRVRKVEPDGRVWWDCPSLENALSQVSKEAVLIHGSKDPAFLPAITGRQIHAIAQGEKPENDQQKHSGISPREIVRESVEPTRQESGEQNGDSRSPGASPEKPLTKEERATERQRKRDYARAMSLREELGLEAMPGTPEFKRGLFLSVNMQWPKLRAYASKIGAVGFGKGNSKPAIVNRVIALEKEQRKEPWTLDLAKKQGAQGANGSHKPVEAGAVPAPATIPVEEAPLVPIGSFPVSSGVKTAVPWHPVDENGRLITPRPAAMDGEIPPHVREKMRQLIANRQAQPA